MYRIIVSVDGDMGMRLYRLQKSLNLRTCVAWFLAVPGLKAWACLFLAACLRSETRYWLSVDVEHVLVYADFCCSLKLGYVCYW